MSIRAVIVGVVTLGWALPAAAQVRGTMELGGFGSAASFDKKLTLNSAVGGGGRVGMFFTPRLSVEFEKAEMRATRTDGLKDVNVGILSARLVSVPVQSGALSLLAGIGGGVSTETNFMHTYGVDALVGMKLALRENIALRIDGVWDWLANENWKTYKSVRVGLSVYRSPSRQTLIETRTVTVAAPAAAPAPMMMMHDDSVSAAETRRLRDRDAALRALRDSLANAPAAPSAANVATMEARIHFAFDKSELTDSAKRILDDKVEVFRANPNMSILMVGYTDVTGTDAYNMALGTRRAKATKDYLVARGIAENRVIIDSKGERQQITNSAGVDGEAPNRRAIFRLLMSVDGKSKE